MSAIVPSVLAREAWAVATRERALLVPIAGCFILLPQLAALLVLPPTPTMAQGASMAEFAAALSGWFQENMWPLVAFLALSLLGQAAIAALLVDRARPTVGEALARGAGVLPWLVLATLFANLAIGGGLLLLVLPGLYLMGRMYLLAVTMVAEGWRNPVAGVIRSVRLTHGMGWMLFALLAAVWLVTTAIGTVFAGIALGGGAAPLVFLGRAGQAAVETAGSVAHILLAVAIYRRVAPRG